MKCKDKENIQKAPREKTPYLQAYLRDTLTLVPEYCNTRITWFFWFPSTYKTYVYTILESIKLSIQQHYLLKKEKKQCIWLNKKCFIAGTSPAIQ